ncbi:unnamed protein product, partial [Brenthis ino]
MTNTESEEIQTQSSGAMFHVDEELPNLSEMKLKEVLLPFIMDTLDDSEKNAKVSDSAYSNSCSNSQSRRSHSSKSTHSGSHSSGSSGYGGIPSTSGSSNNINQDPEERIKDKEIKKKKKVKTEVASSEVKKETQWPPAPVFETPKENNNDVDLTPPASSMQVEKGPEDMDISTSDKSSGKDEPSSCNILIPTPVNVINTRHLAQSEDGFTCVISMQDGVVMYTASSITTALGFPKDMWIGRSFIDFVHPKDRTTFASQITSGLAVPKNVNAPALGNHVCSMVCRIRRYRGVTSGYRVKDRAVAFMPFTLKFYFKNINDKEGHEIIYLVIQATPFFSAFKTPNEVIPQAEPFVIRHSASGILEHIDSESVPYLGYLPQDIVDKDALQLYHPSDLLYLCQVYETIVKEGVVPRSKPYRMLAQNGNYLKLETEWSSFVNPWSKKLVFVIAKHYIIEGPANPDVFQSPESEIDLNMTEEEKSKAEELRQNIIKVMNEALTKPAEAAKQQMSKRCQELASFMETLMQEAPKEDEFRLDIQEADHSCFERDSVMLGGISPHHDCNESKSSTETPISYNQLNYNDNLQRYFDSHEPFEEYNIPIIDIKLQIQNPEPLFSNYLPARQPISCCSGDNVEGTNASDSKVVVLASSSQNSNEDEHQQVRLTESLLTKHNAEMEKEMVKMHRENRLSKGERDKNSSETRQKKKEHFARCNALHQSTTAAVSQPHGIKRASKQKEETGAPKQRCSSPRLHTKQSCNGVNAPTTASNPVMPPPWPASQATGMNTYIVPQPMSLMSPVHVPGVIPVYYTPTTDQSICSMETLNSTANSAQFQTFAHPGSTMYNINQVSNSTTSGPNITNTGMPYQSQSQMPCVMFGQSVYGTPVMYSSINPQIYTMQHNFLSTNEPNVHQLLLPDRNYEEACKTLPMRSGKRLTLNTWKQKTMESMPKVPDAKKATSDISPSSVDVSNRKTESAPSQDSKKRKSHKSNSNATAEKTDEESSYSSLYSSFFKTESGSTDESEFKNKDKDERMKRRRTYDTQTMQNDAAVKNESHPMKVAKKEQVCLTSEIIYKYQIVTKTLEEVLSRDKEKLQNFEQPTLVNEQLGQLYLDLQLEGVAARLTLEEGITSSSSSCDESSANSAERKCEYSKLTMIFEEDAPLPPPET